MEISEILAQKIMHEDLIQFKIFVNIADLSCIIFLAQNVLIPSTHILLTQIKIVTFLQLKGLIQTFLLQYGNRGTHSSCKKLDAIKGPLSGLRQFVIMFGYVEKCLDKKVMVSFKICDVADWTKIITIHVFPQQFKK